MFLQLWPIVKCWPWNWRRLRQNLLQLIWILWWSRLIYTISRRSLTAFRIINANRPRWPSRFYNLFLSPVSNVLALNRPCSLIRWLCLPSSANRPPLKQKFSLTLTNLVASAGSLSSLRLSNLAHAIPIARSLATCWLLSFAISRSALSNYTSHSILNPLGRWHARSSIILWLF